MNSQIMDSYRKNIRSSLYALDPNAALNLERTPDFLTSLLAWRIVPTLVTPTERHLLGGLNKAERQYYFEWLSFLAYGIDFDGISRIAASTNEQIIEHYNYVSEANKKHTDKAARMAKLQIGIEADYVFMIAESSLSDSVESRLLEKYLEKLCRSYDRLADLVEGFRTSRALSDHADDNPVFRRILDVFSRTQEPALAHTIYPEYSFFVYKVLQDTLKGTGIIESAVLDKDDYYLSGFIGFGMAMPRYDPAQGTKLSSFAGIRIAGEIIDEARRFDMVPRPWRSKIRQYEAITQRHDSTYQTAINEFETADKLGVTVAELREIIWMSSLKVQSLDRIVNADTGDKPVTFGESLDVSSAVDEYRAETPEDIILRKERGHLLQKCIQQLPQDQRKAFEAYYFYNIPLKEIGQSGYLGRELKEARICVILQKARNNVIASLRNTDEELEEIVREGLADRTKHITKGSRKALPGID